MDYDMKKILMVCVALFAIVAMTACKSGMKHLASSNIYPIPSDLDLNEVEGVWELIDTVPYDEMTEQQRSLMDFCENCGPLLHFYSPSCSWYCGGIIDTVVSSSAMNTDEGGSYEGKNTHDWNIRSAWVTREEQSGVGESLTYTFPGNCPRITTVIILNGYTRDTSDWQDYSRVKRLKMYYDGQPYAILELQDTRDEQDFDVGLLGYCDVDHPEDWTLRFEILEVYPGRKYRNAAITELYFDGIDVH